MKKPNNPPVHVKPKIRIIPAFVRWMEPMRYKVAFGGRGGGKSENIARLLIKEAMSRKIRILCAREVLKSLRESVHYVIAGAIEDSGVSDVFNIMRDSIECTLTGSEFLFAGLAHNISNIKSMGGIDIVWIEEAEELAAETWIVLDPTIRKEGSEIWLSFNPKDEDSLAYKFTLHPFDDMMLTEVNFCDNPLFPPELDRIRLRAETVLGGQADYEWVWLGKPKKNLDDRILSGIWKISNTPIVPSKDWSGPYYGADWGFSKDPTTLVECWVYEDSLYITREYVGYGVDIDMLPGEFKRAIPESAKHVILADSSAPANISYFNRNGFPRMKKAKKGKGSVKEGITRIRGFKAVYIAKECVETISEFRLYAWKIDKNGKITDEPLPGNDHLIDGIRYAISDIIFKGRGSKTRRTARSIIGSR